MHPLAQEVAQPFAFVTGATVGSFLNVVIYRLPRGESLVSPRSRCPSCGTMVAAWQNVPILSWLILRGRCWTCSARISPRYPVVELVTGMLWLAVVSRYGLTLAALAGVILASSLVAISFIDIDIWEIPDEISLPGIVIGAALRPFAFGAPWFDGLAGAAVGAGALYLVRWIFLKLRGVEGMGLGDVKLIAMLAAFLGLQSVLPIVLVSSIVGAVIGGVMLLVKKPEAPADAEPAEPTAGADAEPAEPTSAVDASAPSKDSESDEDDDWVPPPTAVPYGPFLAIAGLAELLTGPLLDLLRYQPWR